MVKGIPVLVLVGLSLLTLGGLLHIIGIASPYWTTISFSTLQTQDNNGGHHGLWLECSIVSLLQTVDCTEHKDVQGFVVATRALTILSLLLGILCILVTGLWFVLKIQTHQLILMISSLGTGFLCGLFSLIAIIVYAAEVKSKENAVNKVSMSFRYSYTLGWSFALCTVASVLAVIAVVLIAVGIRMMKR